MYSKEEKIRRLKNLSKLEMEVMFYFSQNLDDNAICDKLNNISIKTLNTRRTGIYKTLGVDAPDKEKQNYLFNEYVPIMPEVCPDEATLKSWRPTKSEENGKTSEGNEKEPKRRRSVLPLVITLFACFVLAGVGYGGFMLGQGRFQVPFLPSPIPSQVPFIPSETPQVTDTPVASSTPLSTETPIPTLTSTPEPTFTPLPTATEFVPPADGILFQDNFDNGGASTSWQPSVSHGTWRVINSRYTLTGESEQIWSYSLVGDITWKNYIVDVDYSLDKDIYAGAAVIVRSGGSNNLVLAFIDWGGYPKWSMWQNGNWQTIVKSDSSNGNYNPGHLRVEVKGDSFIGSMSNFNDLTITDTSTTSGQVGLAVWCRGVDECPTFDNFKVTYLP